MVIGALGFWGAFLLMFLFIPVTIAWAWSIFDNFARDDHSGWAKALWFLVLVFLPLFGTLIYVIARPPEDRVEVVYSNPEPAPVAAPSVSTEIERLSELHNRGVIDDEQYTKQKERLLA